MHRNPIYVLFIDACIAIYWISSRKSLIYNSFHVGITDYTVSMALNYSHETFHSIVQ